MHKIIATVEKPVLFRQCCICGGYQDVDSKGGVFREPEQNLEVMRIINKYATHTYCPDCFVTEMAKLPAEGDY